MRGGRPAAPGRPARARLSSRRILRWYDRVRPHSGASFHVDAEDPAGCERLLNLLASGILVEGLDGQFGLDLDDEWPLVLWHGSGIQVGHDWREPTPTMATGVERHREGSSHFPCPQSAQTGLRQERIALRPPCAEQQMKRLDCSDEEASPRSLFATCGRSAGVGAAGSPDAGLLVPYRDGRASGRDAFRAA